MLQVLQDVKPNIAELAHQQDHASASNSYPVTVVVPPEMILRHSLGDHVLDPGDKGDDENKDKDRMRDGKNRLEYWKFFNMKPEPAALAERDKISF